jgi:hypothetical protein
MFQDAAIAKRSGSAVLPKFCTNNLYMRRTISTHFARSWHALGTQSAPCLCSSSAVPVHSRRTIDVQFMRHKCAEHAHSWQAS